MKNSRIPRVFTIRIVEIGGNQESVGTVAIAAFDMSVTGTYAKRHLYISHEQAVAFLDGVLHTIQGLSAEFEFNIRRGLYVQNDDINFAVWRGLDDQTLTLEQWPSKTTATDSMVVQVRNALGGYLYDIEDISQIIREYGYHLTSEEGVFPEQQKIERTPNTVTIDGQTYVRLAEERETD